MTARRPLIARLALLAVALAAVPIATASPIPLREQYRDARVYADSARHLARGDGYVAHLDGVKLQPPQYPPGFPLALSPFVKLGGDYPESAQFASKLIALLLLVAVSAAAWILGGPAAAALAALIVGVSPFGRDMAKVVMSDALAAVFTVLVLALLARPTRAHSAAAGALASVSVGVRLINVTTLLSALVGLRRPRLIAVALAGAIPLVVAVLVWQWSAFGGPLETGYAHYSPGFASDSYAPHFAFDEDLEGDGSLIVHDRADGILTRWTCPCRDDNPLNGGLSNAFFYPAVLLGLYWVYAPPFLTLVGLWELYKRRRSTAGRFSIALGLSTLLLVVPYWYRAARLVAPAAMVLVVFTALGLSRLGARFFPAWPDAGARAS